MYWTETASIYLGTTRIRKNQQVESAQWNQNHFNIGMVYSVVHQQPDLLPLVDLVGNHARKACPFVHVQIQSTPRWVPGSLPNLS